MYLYTGMFQAFICTCTVEPRYNKPLYNTVLGITNNVFYTVIADHMKKNLDIMKPHYTCSLTNFASPLALCHIEVTLKRRDAKNQQWKKRVEERRREGKEGAPFFCPLSLYLPSYLCYFFLLTIL